MNLNSTATEKNMTLNATNILLRHDLIAIPASNGEAGEEAVATVLMNLSHYGRGLSVEGFKALLKLGAVELADWWVSVEPELKDITGADRKMGDFVVYKNFPQEVLDKDAAAYWIPQILMYWGFSKEFFTDPVAPRPKMDKQPAVTVLKLAKKDTLQGILDSLVKSSARWKDQEFQEVLFLSDTLPVNFAKLAFKENLVKLATHFMTSGRKVNITTATDVLRLAAGLSDGDVSLREKFKFKSFKKPMRRFLLGILEGCANLEEDVARRPELFKRLFHNLHAGDFKRSYPRVIKVMDGLYKDQLETFNGKVENMLTAKNPEVLELLAGRPGDFRRRLVHTLDIFGKRAAKAFSAADVLSKLTVNQLVATRSFLGMANERKTRIFPPKGNWSLAKFGEPRPVAKTNLKIIDKAIGAALADRVPAVGVLDPATSKIKLPSNGEEGPYNRGTVFPIPEGTDFFRTASYWNVKASSYTWFDNGWNFFDQNWNPVGACCWSSPKFPGSRWDQKANDKTTGAVFSGDPTIATGKACQMIDLYPEQLRAAGVRYAVWSVLCYSGMPFNQAEEVFAAFQWGKDANRGKLFEPARAQLAIPLKGEQLTKYVVLIDLDKNEMIYLDAGLKSSVRSAEQNGPLLQKNLPAFMEYIKALPSVHDLFRESVDKRATTQILYSDKDAELKGGSAYVFKQENKESKYKSVDLNGLLAK
jgi:hypothetical protein